MGSQHPVTKLTKPCDPAQILELQARPPWVHDHQGITPHHSHTTSRHDPLRFLLAALALTSGAALNIAAAGNASAMTIAWDCFDRTSQALVARSAVDLTSPSISCLQAVGGGAQPAETNSAQPEAAPGLADQQGINDTLAQEAPTGENNVSDQGQVEPEEAPPMNTREALSQAVGAHLGKLIGQGFADLFGRR